MPNLSYPQKWITPVTYLYELNKFSIYKCFRVIMPKNGLVYKRKYTNKNSIFTIEIIV